MFLFDQILKDWPHEELVKRLGKVRQNYNTYIIQLDKIINHMLYLYQPKLTIVVPSFITKRG